MSSMPADAKILGGVSRRRASTTRRGAWPRVASTFQISFAGHRLEREEVLAGREVHHAVDDERRALEEAALSPVSNVQARFSVATLAVVICVSVENREAPGS